MAKPNNRRKSQAFSPNRCSFKVDLNNLAPKEVIVAIFEKFDDDVIERLNQIIVGIKFYVGGNQRHYGLKGFVDAGTFQFDCKKRVMYFYMFKIFKAGFDRWLNLAYGALKRFLFESLVHEILKALGEILRIDLTFIDKASQIDFSTYNMQRFENLDRLFPFREEPTIRINYISIGREFWMMPLPKSLGFLDVLYNRKLKENQKDVNTTFISFNHKLRVFNELRKLKLKYQYEYNLSELVNYVITHKQFRTHFRANEGIVFSRIKRELYYKAKRRILKFFKTYDIMDELVVYTDSASRNHLFLTHTTFERVKSACLQNCLATIKNKTVENYNKFKEFYNTCPICKRKDVNSDICETLFFSKNYEKYEYFRKDLMEKMETGFSFEDLNDEVHYFGIPCSECFEFTENVQGKYSDFNQIQRFIREFSVCPVCLGRNEPNYLIDFYHDESRRDLRDSLIEYMLFREDSSEKYELVLGIPCCQCFSQIFGHEEFVFNVDGILP